MKAEEESVRSAEQDGCSLSFRFVKFLVIENEKCVLVLRNHENTLSLFTLMILEILESTSFFRRKILPYFWFPACCIRFFNQYRSTFLRYSFCCWVCVHVASERCIPLPCRFAFSVGSKLLNLLDVYVPLWKWHSIRKSVFAMQQWRVEFWLSISGFIRAQLKMNSQKLVLLTAKELQLKAMQTSFLFHFDVRCSFSWFALYFVLLHHHEAWIEKMRNNIFLPKSGGALVIRLELI